MVKLGQLWSLIVNCLNNVKIELLDIVLGCLYLVGVVEGQVGSNMVTDSQLESMMIN